MKNCTCGCDKRGLCLAGLNLTSSPPSSPNLHYLWGMETVPDEECLPVWVVQLQFVLVAEP